VAMGDPTGEADRGALRLDFDRRLLLQFRSSAITSDAGLLTYRELDDTLRLTDTGADTLADARTGKNGRHQLAGLLRQSVFGRVALMATSSWSHSFLTEKNWQLRPDVRYKTRWKRATTPSGTPTRPTRSRRTASTRC